MMADQTEVHWIEIVRQHSPRFIQSEGVWAVTYQNEFDLEVERFTSLKEAEEFCETLDAGRRALSEGDRHG